MFLLLAFLCGNVLASLPPRPQYPGLRLAFETDFDTLADFTARDNYVQTPYAESCCACARGRPLCPVELPLAVSLTPAPSPPRPACPHA